MRKSLLALVVIAFVCPAGRATADRGGSKEAAKPAPPPTSMHTGDPPAGECFYQAAGVKRCSVVGGAGSFDVAVYPPHALVIELPEPVLSFTLPATKAVYSVPQPDEGDKTVEVLPKTPNLPARSPMVIRTGSLSVTVNLVPASSPDAVDSQIIIVDPEHEHRLEQREADVQKREDAAKKKEADLDTRANARADELLLEEIASGGADVHDTDAITSNSALIVLKARSRVRVGQRRYLVVSLENLSADPFEVTDVKVFLDEGSGAQPVPATWRFTTRIAKRKDEIQGAIFLALPAKVSSKAHLKVRVDERDPSRSVELGGIKVP